MASVLAGCGSGGGPAGLSGNPPPAEANSTVTVVLSGTANDQLSEFDIEFQSITLTGTGGKTVTLLSQSQTSEFIHVNGTTEPLLTVTVPQDVYTAATVAVGGAQSLLATRIAVEDPSPVDVQRGPILFVSNSSSPVMYMDPRQEQGMDRRVDMETFNFGSATFQISGQLNNLPTLPFTPSFAASNMVPGQNVYISSPAFLLTGPYLAVATTITLMPQTINATVVGSSTSGNFTVYNVALGAYDPFPSLAVQPGQTALLTDPNNVEVYVDSQTLMLNSSAPAVGNTLRFYGLVFNDNGTLRMDCAQISDGVTI
jgi:hypothetical protein